MAVVTRTYAQHAKKSKFRSVVQAIGVSKDEQR